MASRRASAAAAPLDFYADRLQRFDDEKDQADILTVNAVVLSDADLNAGGGAAAGEDDMAAATQLVDNPVVVPRARKAVAVKPARKQIPPPNHLVDYSQSDSGERPSEDDEEPPVVGDDVGDVGVCGHDDDDDDGQNVDMESDEGAPTSVPSAPSAAPSLPVPVPVARPRALSPTAPPPPTYPYDMTSSSSSMVPLGGGGGSSSSSAVEDNMRMVTASMVNMSRMMEGYMAVTTRDISNLATETKKTSDEVKVLSSRMKKMHREIMDFKRGVSNRAGNMDYGLDNIRREQKLSQVFNFISRFGMDTRSGYVVAFPVTIADQLCVAVSLHLLNYALLAMMPVTTRGQKEFTLAGLRMLMGLVKTESVRHTSAQQFCRLFAVNEYTGTAQRQASNNIQAWRVYRAEVFVRALQIAEECEGNFLEQEAEPELLNWTNKQRMMFSQDAIYDKDMCRRMSWSHVVQEEVLALPEVHQFFKLVSKLRSGGARRSRSRGGSSSSSSSRSRSSSESSSDDESRDADDDDQAPVHFCGLRKDPTYPVLPHAELVKRFRREQQRKQEAEAERLRDDTIDREYVGGRSMRKRKAPAAAAAAAPPAAKRRAPPARGGRGRKSGKQPRVSLASAAAASAAGVKHGGAEADEGAEEEVAEAEHDDEEEGEEEDADDKMSNYSCSEDERAPRGRSLAARTKKASKVGHA